MGLLNFIFGKKEETKNSTPQPAATQQPTTSRPAASASSTTKAVELSIAPFVFESNQHQRYENGNPVKGLQKCPRTIKVEKNENGCSGYQLKSGDGYIVRMINGDTGKSQMSAKPMRVIKSTATEVTLRGYMVSAQTPFGFQDIDMADYGLTVSLKDGKVVRCVLHMYDRNVDIEYRKEAERKAKIESENSKKYQILDFYLDCSHWRAQQEKLRVTPLALPIKRVDVEEDEDTREKYKVNNLPKLILVDLNGKEIYRWKGITEPSEINEYLYNNGYAERPAMSNPNSDTNNKENIFQATDMKLASQFVVESMSNLGYEPYSDFSDDFAVAELQKQFSHYCLMAKSNLAMDAIGKADPFIAAFKQHIRNYISNASNKNNQAMKYLYELSDTDLLVQQISMLSLHANTKHVQDIDNLSQEEFHAAMNPENVSLAMGLYTYFTILVNDNLSADDFNELFVESWIKYYGNAQARIFMFRMRGNSWKNDFKGVLLDD